MRVSNFCENGTPKAWHEERRVESSQELLEQARTYGDVVPIVVWPDGRVEQGFEGSLGCFI
jgi:hypothetical protein